MAARCGCCACSAPGARRCRLPNSCAASPCRSGRCWREARGDASPAARTMTLYALTLEYDGAPFVGWQRQENGLAVQQVLEEAAARLNDGVVPASIAAGRTDAGVHAEGQVAQLELARDLAPEKLREA